MLPKSLEVYQRGRRAGARETGEQDGHSLVLEAGLGVLATLATRATTGGSNPIYTYTQWTRIRGVILTLGVQFKIRALQLVWLLQSKSNFLSCIYNGRPLPWTSKRITTSRVPWWSTKFTAPLITRTSSVSHLNHAKVSPNRNHRADNL